MERQAQELLRQIHIQDWKPDYVVGLTRGGLTPAVMISQYLNIPMYALKVSLRDATDDSESNLWMAEEAFGYVAKEDREKTISWSDVSKRKNILIVDDINDSGATFNWIKEDWQSGCHTNSIEVWQEVWATNVKFAVLVNNESSKFKDINFQARSINKNDFPQWVVFPWEQWW